jgi:hypothetical protein
MSAMRAPNVDVTQHENVGFRRSFKSMPLAGMNGTADPVRGSVVSGYPVVTPLPLDP